MTRSIKASLVSLVTILVFLTLLAGCSTKQSEMHETDAKEERVRVGFSQTESDNPWTTNLVDGFIQAAEALDMELIYHTPEENTSRWQLQDINNLFSEDLDYLVVFPREASILDEVCLKAEEYGVPLILIGSQEDYGSSNNTYACVISTDYVQEGRLCAQILAKQFDGQVCRIVEIKGSEDSRIAQDRSRGFHEELQKYSNLRIVATGIGNSDRLTAQYALENIIVNYKEDLFNAVFACSDEDGLGALQALKVAGYNPDKDVSIVSCNGIQDVLKAIIANEYTATVRSDSRLGYIACDIIKQLEHGFTKIKHVVVPYRIYQDSKDALYFLY